MPIRLIVLAAGKGTRMKSALPKVLHELAGKPLLAHVLDTAAGLEPDGVTVVVGHGADRVRAGVAGEVGDAPIDWVVQERQLGTGHAVREALSTVADDDTVLVTYGDVPLTRASTWRRLLDVADDSTIALLTLMMGDPTGYGRVLREAGQVVGVVEQKDATLDQLAIHEVNAGVLAVRGDHLKRLLARIDSNNAQGEYYLTDIFALAVRDGLAIEAVHPDEPWEVDGVNSRAQLARLERLHQGEIAVRLMDSGASLADPSRIDVRGALEVGDDVSIDVNCVFEGRCELGDGVTIGANCVLRDARVAAGATVHPNSMIEGSEVGAGASVGPYARLRPGTRLAEGSRVGNFVETKNARIGVGSKVNHLSYIGDAELGRSVNVGAGTITCNYDGANKHRTVIEDDVFIGSNSALVAPITVEKGATVGAGSTVSRQVAGGALVLTRARAVVVPDWPRPTKDER